jgi:transposase
MSAADAVSARLASKVDWTVRALAADLRAAGISVSHDTVWRFMRRQGLSFKKNAARQRDGTAGPGAPADTLADASAPV